MYGHYFYYNSHTSQDFGLFLGGFDIDQDIPLGLNRNILKGAMNQYRRVPNFMGTSYYDTLSFTISVVRDPCISQDAEDMVFTEDEVDEITTWLTSPNYPTLFHMYDYEPDVYTKYDYFAICNDVSPQVLNGDIIGFKISFVTNAPYAWSEQKTFTLSDNSSENESQLQIPVNTSERLSPVYPVITITPYTIDPTQKMSIMYYNVRDNQVTEVELIQDQIVIDCEHCKIYMPSRSELLSYEDLGIEDADDIYWLKLYHGDNTIVFSGDADITITFREPRKVGVY